MSVTIEGCEEDYFPRLERIEECLIFRKTYDKFLVSKSGKEIELLINEGNKNNKICVFIYYFAHINSVQYQ